MFQLFSSSRRKEVPTELLRIFRAVPRNFSCPGESPHQLQGDRLSLNVTFALALRGRFVTEVC